MGSSVPWQVSPCLAGSGLDKLLPLSSAGAAAMSPFIQKSSTFRRRGEGAFLQASASSALEQHVFAVPVPASSAPRRVAQPVALHYVVGIIPASSAPRRVAPPVALHYLVGIIIATLAVIYFLAVCFQSLRGGKADRFKRRLSEKDDDNSEGPPGDEDSPQCEMQDAEEQGESGDELPPAEEAPVLPTTEGPSSHHSTSSDGASGDGNTNESPGEDKRGKQKKKEDDAGDDKDKEDDGTPGPGDGPPGGTRGPDLDPDAKEAEAFFQLVEAYGFPGGDGEDERAPVSEEERRQRLLDSQLAAFLTLEGMYSDNDEDSDDDSDDDRDDDSEQDSDGDRDKKRHKKDKGEEDKDGEGKDGKDEQDDKGEPSGSSGAAGSSGGGGSSSHRSKEEKRGSEGDRKEGDKRGGATGGDEDKGGKKERSTGEVAEGDQDKQGATGGGGGHVTASLNPDDHLEQELLAHTLTMSMEGFYASEGATTAEGDKGAATTDSSKDEEGTEEGPTGGASQGDTSQAASSQPGGGERGNWSPWSIEGLSEEERLQLAVRMSLAGFKASSDLPKSDDDTSEDEGGRRR